MSHTAAGQRPNRQPAREREVDAMGRSGAGIAHDFNNLLTVVAGAADMVLARPGLDPATLADVALIRRTAARGDALVRRLLAPDRRAGPAAAGPVVIDDAIRDVAEVLRHLLGGSIALELALAAPGRAVRADATDLDRVLINLAKNAAEAMPEGGTLTIRSGVATLLEPPDGRPDAVPPGRYVTIAVEDSGAGIAPDLLPRIFEPAFTTRRDRGGSGLGLAAVAEIVHRSDGFLTVCSEPGKGTRFSIYLPRADDLARADYFARPGGPDAAAAIRAEAGVPSVREYSAGLPAASEPRRSGAVLLVEDEEPVRLLAERALGQRGWRVLSADSADSALRLVDRMLAREGRPDLAVLVTDLAMPGMDPCALVRRLRAIWPGLPAILVSGYAAGRVRRDWALPDTRFLAKPYALRTLLAVVEQAAAPGREGSKQASSTTADITS